MAAKKKSAKKKTTMKKSSKNDDKILFALLAVVLSIIGFIIALAVKKDDDYVMFYAKQSLVLFIAWIVGYIAVVILGTIIVAISFGTLWFISTLLWAVVGLGFLALWIIQIIYSVSGKKQQTPVIGQFAEKIKI